MNKTIYIPGFGNQDDKIRKSAFPEADIIQKTIFPVTSKKVRACLRKSGKKKLRNMIISDYPATTKNDIKLSLEQINKFQGFTRKIETAISFTKKEIGKILETESYINLAGHSQGGLVAIELILKYPELLERIESIELFAPVANYSTGKNFHIGKESGYVNGKGVIVTKDYIDSLNVTEYSLLISLAIRLRYCNYKGKFKIIYSDNDPVIKSETLDLEMIKNIFPEVEIINTKSDNHYLGY